MTSELCNSLPSCSDRIGVGKNTYNCACGQKDCINSDDRNLYCECTGLATAAQHEAIYDVCDEKARKKYMTAGGEVLDWEKSKDDAAMEGGAIFRLFPI